MERWNDGILVLTVLMRLENSQKCEVGDREGGKRINEITAD